MQSIEAVLSILVFSSIALAFSGPLSDDGGIDDSLQRLYLAQDAWRVLQLRGDFQDFHLGHDSALKEDVDSITDLTGLCVFMTGSTRYTSCRGGERHEITASIRRTVIVGGVPWKVTFSLGK